MLRLLALSFATLVTCLNASVAASPGADVDTLAIRYRDAAVPGSPLNLARKAALAAALQSPFSDAGTTRDGAFVVLLNPPLPTAAARLALNVVRRDSDVLYAKTSSGAATALAKARPKADDALPSVPRLIVKFRDFATSNTVSDRGRLDLVASAAGQPVAFERNMGGGETLFVLMSKLTRGDAERVAKVLEANPAVEYADPDLPMHATVTPNDALYGVQWDLYDATGGIDAPAAWNITTGSASLYVGVIDTGIRPHQDLNGRFIGGYDFIGATTVSGDGDGRDADASDPGDWVVANQCAIGSPAEPSSWHGMHVAGTIAAAANNGVGVTGINWASLVVPLRVLGKCGGFTSDIADAIRWGSGASVYGVPANPYPVRVENLSLGGTGSCGTTLQNAINMALMNNTVIVVSAGNDNTDAAAEAPASCNGVITVAATVRNGSKASYSNYGATVEIAAPGGGDGYFIISTVNAGTQGPAGDAYANYQGTSMAAPHVTGVASLVLSINPTLTPSQVLGTLQSTARPFPSGTGRDCTTSICGAGIVNAAAAVASVSGTAAHDYEGYEDSADCSGIAGWAWDRLQVNTPINVDVYADGTLLATVAAGTFRSDLAAAGKGNGAHGFVYATPASLQDGVPHSVAVRFGGTSTPLTNSPRSITCGQSTAASYEGYHDVAACDVLAGWAWDRNQPNTPISVDIYRDGAFTARTLANVARTDLTAAGKGNGVHGFQIATPYSLQDGASHSVSVTFAGTSIALASTPKSLACSALAAPRFDGYYDVADCSTLAGWAWDQNRPNSAIDVDFIVDGAYSQTFLAATFRSDLASAGKGNGAHAFNVATPGSLKDGRAHSLEFRFGGSALDLTNAPKSVNCTP